MKILYLRQRTFWSLFAILCFCVQFAYAQPTNNNCSGAISLTVNSNSNCAVSTAATTIAATQSQAGCTGNADDDVWFSVIPTSTSHYITISGITLADPVLEMFAGSCAGLTSIGCVDGLAGSSEVAIASGLTIGTTYYIRVYSYSAAGQGTFSICVTTPDNPAPYCASNAFDSSSYINNFATTTALTNITNPSGYTAGGYANYTSQSVVAISNSTFNFTSSFTGGTFGFNIWVDWNNNNAFSSAEKVYASGAYVNAASGTITIPNGTPAGNYRMRIRAHWLDTNPPACGDNLDGGETEDYTLTVQPLLCASVPSGLNVNAITATTASANWTAPASAPASGYAYYFSTNSTPPTFANTGSGNTAAGVTTASLSGLAAGTTYYVWVRSNCGGTNGMGTWVGPVSFSTLMQTTGVNICPGGSGSLSAITACGGTTSSLIINGNWNTNPTAIRPYSMTNSTTCSFATTTATYSSYSFQVSVTGNYALTMVQNDSYDGMAYIVSGAFTPGSCGAGTWIVGDDDSGPDNEPALTTNLNAGVTYTLISTIWNSSNITIVNSFQYNVTGPGTILTGATGVIQWYAAATGGTVLGTGNSFNPVGVAGSGIANTNTPITKTFYAACSLSPTARTAVTYTIKTPANATLSKTGSICNNDTKLRIAFTGTQPWSVTYTDGINPPVTVTNITTSPLVIPVFPTTTVTYSITAVSDASCPIGTFGGPLTIPANTWLGVNSSWSNPANWSTGIVPTLSDCVIIPPTSNFATINNSELGYADGLIIKSGGRLDVLNSRTITVKNKVTVEPTGTFNIESGSSLLQTATFANVGEVNLKRDITVKRFDYTYWNSPMTVATSKFLGEFSPGSPTTKFYSWIPSVSNGNGNWQQEAPATTVMTPKKGFIIRPPVTTPINLALQYTLTFVGTPNNGSFTVPVKHGLVAGDDDAWNLIGNPYPSAISVSSFFANALNAVSLDNTVYLWTHNSSPNSSNSQPFYGTFNSNYSESDYATCTGSLGCTQACATCPMPNGFIAAGQAFFVKSKSASTNDNAQFDNSMRVALNNDQFFKTTGESYPLSAALPSSTDNQRVWLNMSNNTNKFNQILVGYAEGATMGFDNGFDGTRFTSSSMSFYSIIDTTKLAIQGRSMPFDMQDQVPLGYTVTENGTYFIGIDHFDAAFGNINIYLEDLLLGVVHDLKMAPYEFVASIGSNDTRFVLRYTSENLSVNAYDSLSVTAFLNKSKLNVGAQQAIVEVQIYDISGKLIVTLKPSSSEHIQIWDFNYAQGAYLAKVKLESGEIATRKLLN